MVPDIQSEYNNQGYRFFPGLAENWTVSSNGTVYSFNLRHNVTFSNGDPFNCYQAWLNFYNIYSSVGNYTFFFQYPAILNTSTIAFGPASISILNSSGLANPTSAALAIMSNSTWPIYCNGANQLVFHMSVPFSYLLGELSGLPGILYDAQFTLKHGWPQAFGSPAMGFFSSNPIPGTGPYMITDYVQNSHITFSQNPTYWGKSLSAAQIAGNQILSPGNVGQVTINYKPDDLSRYTDLSNDVAQIATIQSQNWNLISTDNSTYGYVSFPPSANIVSSLAFNTLKWPMNVTDVRLAIEHAINYSLIYDNVFHGQIHPFFGPETPGFQQYYDVGGYQQYSYNVSLAKSLLNSAGISSFPTVTLSLPSGFTVMDSIAQIIQSELATNLGIIVNLQESSYQNWITPYNQGYAVNSKNPGALSDMTFEGAPSYGQVENVPADNWVTFTTSQGFDLALWQTNTTIALAQALATSNNQSQILALMKQAQSEVYNQAPYIWIGVFQLVLGDGSVAYKRSVVNSFYFDPMWSGANTAPILNTITFVS